MEERKRLPPRFLNKETYILISHWALQIMSWLRGGESPGEARGLQSRFQGAAGLGVHQFLVDKQDRMLQRVHHPRQRSVGTRGQEFVRGGCDLVRMMEP